MQLPFYIEILFKAYIHDGLEILLKDQFDIGRLRFAD